VAELASVDWSNLTVAAAFMLGAVLATIATIRIVRVAASTLREERRKDRDDN
jgi:hypothetical protein